MRTECKHHHSLSFVVSFLSFLSFLFFSLRCFSFRLVSFVFSPSSLFLMSVMRGRCRCLIRVSAVLLALNVFLCTHVSASSDDDDDDDDDHELFQTRHHSTFHYIPFPSLFLCFTLFSSVHEGKRSNTERKPKIEEDDDAQKEDGEVIVLLVLPFSHVPSREMKDEDEVFEARKQFGIFVE